MTGIELIAAERKRQIEVEGWTAEHDAQHTDGGLAEAAACYAMPRRKSIEIVPYDWPWAVEWWKPTPDDRIRELTKAGALIAAELDRLLAEECKAGEE